MFSSSKSKSDVFESRWVAVAVFDLFATLISEFGSNLESLSANVTELLVIDDDIDLHPWSVKRHFFEDQGYTVYSCGFFAPRQDKVIHDLPNSFYDDLAIPQEIRRSYCT
jgi:hypothetical protein